MEKDDESIATEAKDSDDSVSTVEQKSLGLLNAGNYFGEMALVSDSPRSATVSSVGKSILLSVGKESFRTIFASNDNALAEFTLRLLRGSSQLKHLLAHSLGSSTFRSFLRKCVAEENLSFWIACCEFKSSSEGKDELAKMSTDIFHRYCKEGADHQVNLPCTIRSSLEKSLEEKYVHTSLFDPARDEIYRLMVRDNYARFKRTPDFKEFFKCLGILVENDP